MNNKEHNKKNKDKQHQFIKSQISNHDGIATSS